MEPNSPLWYFGLIGESISLFGVVVLFKRDLKKSHTDSDKEKRAICMYYRWFYYMAFTCFVSIIVGGIWYMTKYVPYICRISTQFALSFNLTVRVIIT